jgi:hypothetical protein
MGHTADELFQHIQLPLWLPKTLTNTMLLRTGWLSIFSPIFR